MTLVFRHKGRLRQGDEFIHHSTGDISHPLVYVSHDGEEVFLISRADTGAFSIEPLSRNEWMRIRATYHLKLAQVSEYNEPPIEAAVGDEVSV
jgi:hypothetical protein